MNKLETIGQLYIEHHNRKKEIDLLKYSRSVEFEPCKHEDSESTCYCKMKYQGSAKNICKNCARSWNQHLEIVRLAALNGGVKNKINAIIKSL